MPSADIELLAADHHSFYAYRAEPAGTPRGAIDALKTAPRGVPKDHPRIDLLRRKGLMVSKDFGAPTWLHTGQVVSKIRRPWQGAADMNAWLDAHVGPSTLEPDGFFG